MANRGPINGRNGALNSGPCEAQKPLFFRLNHETRARFFSPEIEFREKSEYGELGQGAKLALDLPGGPAWCGRTTETVVPL